MPAAKTLLKTTGLWKGYAEPVVCDVHLEVRRGEVHALVGENGAGKTTLARIIAGLTQPDLGEMRLGSFPFAPASRRNAEARGVRIVMQELNLVSTLTVAENIFIDRLPRRYGLLDRRSLDAAARPLMARVGLGEVEPDTLVGSLGVGQQQMVEIAAGLSGPCDLLILDEPTAALTGTEVELLFDQMRQLKADGVGILYISHRLEEVRRIADRITVLRDGWGVATRGIGAAPLDELIRLMVDRELSQVVDPAERQPGPPALRVQGLCRGDAVRDVSFEAREGEILGFAGLMGSGRTETMRAIFGADRRDSGEVFLGGSDRPARIRSPSDAVRQGIALLTEDRKEQGLLLPLPVRVNVTLARLADLAGPGGWIRSADEREMAERFARALAVRASSIEQPADELSGGNQQKVVFARWVYRDCKVMLFDEPTRGIDVGAKFEIYRLLADLAAGGKAIVVVSSDLPELMGICDRIAVMSAGRLVATFGRRKWSEDAIIEAAFSGYEGRTKEG